MGGEGSGAHWRSATEARTVREQAREIPIAPIPYSSGVSLVVLEEARFHGIIGTPNSTFQEAVLRAC